jgi:type I restriction enzyme S subunit
VNPGASTACALVPLGKLVRFRNGKSIKPGGEGPYAAFGSNGIIGRSQNFMYRNAIILGRVGAYCGSVAYSPDAFWASDNTIVVEPDTEILDTRYAYYALTDAKLSRYAGGAAQPLVTQQF